MLCKPHHKLKDKGYLIIEETPDGPVFRDRAGNVIGKGRGPPPDTG